MTERNMPRIWLTYAWVDDNEGDFAYLVQELRESGVDATYDKIALVPGRDPWEQIGNLLTAGDIDGWGYLLTQASLSSEACREELSYALNRALNTRGRQFPLVGLLHGVRVADVPRALRVRLCVSLADPDWRERVKAGLEARPPNLSPEPVTKYVWTTHKSYRSNPRLTAVEVRPRFGEVAYWRIIVPNLSVVTRWGYGPSGGGAISGIQHEVIEGGAGTLQGEDITWFGAGDRLTPGTSAYVVFEGQLPEFIGFGTARDPLGPPEKVEVVPLS